MLIRVFTPEQRAIVITSFAWQARGVPTHRLLWDTWLSPSGRSSLIRSAGHAPRSLECTTAPEQVVTMTRGRNASSDDHAVLVGNIHLVGADEAMKINSRDGIRMLDRRY